MFNNTSHILASRKHYNQCFSAIHRQTHTQRDKRLMSREIILIFLEGRNLSIRQDTHKWINRASNLNKFVLVIFSYKNQLLIYSQYLKRKCNFYFTIENKVKSLIPLFVSNSIRHILNNDNDILELTTMLCHASHQL